MSIYSDVFKKRVLQAHSKGLSITECSEKYEIHRSTVSRWIDDAEFESKLYVLMKFNLFVVKVLFNITNIQNSLFNI